MQKISYVGYRFPPEIIHRAIWFYLRFTLSLRDVEDLLAERGVAVSYETVRRWVNHFGPMIASDSRKRRQKPHTTWHLDEVYLKIDGRMVYREILDRSQSVNAVINFCETSHSPSKSCSRRFAVPSLPVGWFGPSRTGRTFEYCCFGRCRAAVKGISRA